MKRLAFLVLCAAGAASAADLAAVHKVYLLRMPKGFDQYLANRLTEAKVFQVVTDPKMADTVITDHIGEAFQAKLDELYPPPEEPKPEKPAPPEKSAKAKAADEPVDSPLITDTVNKLTAPASNSSFGTAKGMIFLVDPKSKQVIWSAYGLPKGSTSRELDRAASDIVGRIKHELAKK